MSRQELLCSIRELTLKIAVARKEERLLGFQVQEVRQDIARCQAQVFSHMLESSNLPHQVGVVQEVLDKRDLGRSGDDDDDYDEGDISRENRKRSIDHNSDWNQVRKKSVPFGIPSDSREELGRVDDNPETRHSQAKEKEEEEASVIHKNSSGCSREVATIPRTFHASVEPAETTTSTFIIGASGGRNTGTFSPTTTENEASSFESNMENPRSSGKSLPSPSISVSVLNNNATVLHVGDDQVIYIADLAIGFNHHPETVIDNVVIDHDNEINDHAYSTSTSDTNAQSTLCNEIAVPGPLGGNSTTTQSPDFSVKTDSSSNENTNTFLIFVAKDQCTSSPNNMDNKEEFYSLFTSASLSETQREQMILFNDDATIETQIENTDLCSFSMEGGNVTEDGTHDASFTKNYCLQSEGISAESTATVNKEEILNPEMKREKLKCIDNSICKMNPDTKDYSIHEKCHANKETPQSSKERSQDSKQTNVVKDFGKLNRSSINLVKAKKTISLKDNPENAKSKDNSNDQTPIITEVTSNMVVHEFANNESKNEHNSDEQEHFFEFLQNDTLNLEDFVEVSNLRGNVNDQDGDHLSTNQNPRAEKGYENLMPNKKDEKVFEVPNNGLRKENKNSQIWQNRKTLWIPQTSQKVRTVWGLHCANRMPDSDSSGDAGEKKDVVNKRTHISSPMRQQCQEKHINIISQIECDNPNQDKKGNKTPKTKERQDSPVASRDFQKKIQKPAKMEIIEDDNYDEWSCTDVDESGESCSSTDCSGNFLSVMSSPGTEKQAQSWKSDKFIVVRTFLRSHILLRYHPYVIEDAPQGIQTDDLVGMKENFEGHYRLVSRLPRDDESCLMNTLLLVERPTDTFEDVMGYEDQIQELKEAIVLPLLKPGLFQKIGIEPCQGILLYGPPGTGKTLLARACANACGCAFLCLSGTFLLQKFLGAGATVVRKIFEIAKTMTPCIIFIDDIDAIGKIRRPSLREGDNEIQRTLLELLYQLDGFSSNHHIKILAATNRADIIDPALLRSGRLDRKIKLDLPNLLVRKLILEKHTEKLVISECVNFEELAKLTNGFSGAHCKVVCTEAGLQCLRRGGDIISHEDFSEGVAIMQTKRRVVPPYFA
ncbi:uncharacterized protein LOC143040096 [Oratosquilla oratoria]|uniref:uncharacterized protein LOC143040096 n=1 Tax=Oratosquilla oratoria TaxID=337810 RepID=UPI003F770879